MPKDGEQPDGTFLFAKDKKPVPHVATGGTGVVHSQTITKRIPDQDLERKRRLWNDGRMLADAQAALMAYAAKKYGGVIPGEDIRALLITVYIQNRKRAGAKR